MENENSKSSSSSEEDSEYSDIDSDRPNLLQINKKIDKMNRKKNISLLEKKRNRNKNFSDIIFDANKKTIEDSFIPNLEELNDFLKNCKIEEIKIEELEKIPKEKIFDPDLFIEENYGKKEVDKNELKHSFSIEDLGFEFDIKEKNDFLKEEKLEEDKIYDSKNEDKLNLNDKEKGEFQHKMFKLIILLIAFIFCCLIGGFVYITITSSSSKKEITSKIIEGQFSTEESIIQSNQKYYKIISDIDKDNYNLILNKNITKECSMNNFYKTYIYQHIPCISKNNITNLADKYFKYISSKIYNEKNGNEDFLKMPKLDNNGRICINNSENKLKILLSPISQIKFFNTKKIESDDINIINIYLKDNIDERKDAIYYEFILDKFDYIYIPSYYFIQTKESLNNFVCYEYQDLSFLNDIIFKILYN